MSTIRTNSLGLVSLLLAASAVGAAAQTPAGSPLPVPADAELQAGTEYYMDGAWGAGSPRFIFTVPGDGWSTQGVWNIGKDVLPDDPPHHDLAVTPWRVENVYVDPCHWRTGGLVDPPVGPGVDDLAAALVSQSGDDPSAVTDVTVGDQAGKRVELTQPAGLDLATCDYYDPGFPLFGRWMEADTPGGHTYGAGQVNAVYILDLDGQRAVIDTNHLPGVSEADLVELDALVTSIGFEPLTGSTAEASEAP